MSTWGKPTLQNPPSQVFVNGNFMAFLITQQSAVISHNHKIASRRQRNNSAKALFAKHTSAGLCCNASHLITRFQRTWHISSPGYATRLTFKLVEMHQEKLLPDRTATPHRNTNLMGIWSVLMFVQFILTVCKNLGTEKTFSRNIPQVGEKQPTYEAHALTFLSQVKCL